MFSKDYIICHNENENPGTTELAKKYQRIPDPDYFTIGKDFLLSPFEKIVYLKKCPILTLLSGTDALAEQTMLNPPNHPIRAIIQRKQLK